MKEMIVTTGLNSLRKFFSRDVIDSALAYVHWDKTGIIHPLENISNEEILQIVMQVFKGTNESVKNIWREVGNQSIKILQKWFTTHFQRESLRGLFEYLLGLFERSLDYFNEKIEITEPDKGKMVNIL